MRQTGRPGMRQTRGAGMARGEEQDAGTRDVHASLPLVLDACRLPAADRPLRAAEFGRLFTETVLRAERPGPTRLHLDLTPGPQVAARAAELAARETQCCSFFTFALTVTGEKLSLEVTAPDAHVAVLDAIAALLTGPA